MPGETEEGDGVFRVKAERGYESINLTPEEGKAIGWSGGVLTNITAGGSVSTIVGITGTKAQFDTAVTDGNFVYQSDIGTNVQAYDADLTSWAGIAPASKADAAGPIFSGNVVFDSGTTFGYEGGPAITSHLTALGIVPGTNIVAYNGALGTPTSGTINLSNVTLTGTAEGLTAGNVTTNANLTGHVTSTGNAAVLGSFTLAQLSTAVSDANVARTDAAQTIAGIQTFSDATGASSTTVAAAKFAGGIGVVENVRAGGGMYAVGNFISSGGGLQASTSGLFSWTNRNLIAAPTDGTITLSNYASSLGIGLDFATDGTLKIRNRSNAAGTGNIDAGGTVIASNFKRGTGSPEAAVTGSVGDLYTRTDGGANTTLYVKESGSATNTGWIAK